MNRKAYNHEDGAEEEHVKEVGGAAAERALFEHHAVAIGKDHVEQEAESERSEETERRQQSPHLQ